MPAMNEAEKEALRLFELACKPPIKQGRPTKYKPEYVKQAYDLCFLGAVDADLARSFDCCIDTISEWKNKYPKFSASVKNAKHDANNRIKRSLYERAKGYEHKELKVFCYMGEIITKEVIKHYPPDSTSLQFFLRNRERGQWDHVDNKGTDDNDIAEALTNLADKLPS